MPNAPVLLALDQGTTSTRAIVFDPALTLLASAQRDLAQHFPSPGWVEHAPEDLWDHSVAVLRDALAQARATPAQVAGLGLTNQRETTLLWDRASGRALHRAIVWQDRRTADACARLRDEGAEPLIAARTGLRADPYFSATKLAWLLDAIPGARAAADRGALCFGTVDSFLLFRLTGGRVHATDATNASRTALYDLHRGVWDDQLLRLFDIPASLLPTVTDSAGDLGTTDAAVLGAPVPIRGIAGDQQAAAMGQACFAPGMLKCTFGTGAFALLHTGAQAVASRSRLLTTVAWQLGGARAYALEGSIFAAGAAVQWLRDGLGLVAHAEETGALAAQADPHAGVHLVPAFAGLGAPWWDADARGALLGLSRGTGRAEIARAALECVAFQTRDLLDAMQADGAVDAPRAFGTVDAARAFGTVDAARAFGTVDAARAFGTTPAVLRVDGGMSASDWTMQFLADLLGAPVDRPTIMETTALGAAWLAGVGAGLLPGPDAPAAHPRLERRFLPSMAPDEADARHAAWRAAVARVLTADRAPVP